MCRRHAHLMDLKPGGIGSEVTVSKANTLLLRVDPSDQVARQRVVTANGLVDDIARLDTQMLTSKKRIRVAVGPTGAIGLEACAANQPPEPAPRPPGGGRAMVRRDREQSHQPLDR